MRSASSSRSRGSIPRARSRSIRRPAREERAQLRVRERCELADLVTPAAPSRASARGRRPAGRAPAGREEARLRPGGTTVIPPGLRRSDATLQTTFDARHASEHERLGRAAHGGLHRTRERAGAGELGDHRAEVEIALVEPGSLDARDDLAHAAHTASSTGGRAGAGAARNGLRAAAECLGARSSPSGSRTAAPT